jgi:hypothetical protein
VQTFKTFITEIFDSPVKYRRITNSDDEVVYRFKVTDDLGGELEYTVNFSNPGMGKKTERKWDIDFKLTVDSEYGPDPYEKQTLFDTGVSFQVFSTVASIVIDWVKNTSPGYFTFSADTREPSRAKLYDTLSSKLSKKIDYKLKVFNLGGSAYKQYDFTKK